MGDTWNACTKRKERKMRRKGERKKGRKEDLTASSSEFRHSNGQSSSSPELKLAMLQKVGIFFLVWLIST